MVTKGQRKNSTFHNVLKSFGKKIFPKSTNENSNATTVSSTDHAQLNGDDNQISQMLWQNFSKSIARYENSAILSSNHAKIDEMGATNFQRKEIKNPFLELLTNPATFTIPTEDNSHPFTRPQRLRTYEETLRDCLDELLIAIQMQQTQILRQVQYINEWNKVSVQGNYPFS